MIHFDWTVSLTALIGWALGGIGLAFGIGKIAAAIEHLGSSVKRIEGQLAAHCEDDIQRFSSIQEQLTQIAVAIRQGG